MLVNRICTFNKQLKHSGVVGFPTSSDQPARLDAVVHRPASHHFLPEITHSEHLDQSANQR